MSYSVTEPLVKEIEPILVAAMVKYDLFPHYVVVKGELLGDGCVRVPGIGKYKPENVLRILPPEAYKRESETLGEIRQKYRQGQQELKQSLLETYGLTDLVKKGE